MVGSVSEAEDLVQEAFLRYHRASEDDEAAIESPKAYLSAVTTRLAIDHLRSARHRRERYGGSTGAGLARPVHGSRPVSRLLRIFAERLERARVTVRPAEINGQPGVLCLDEEGRLVAIAALDIADGVVRAVHSIVNPDKLRHLGPVSDPRRLLRSPGQ